MKLHTVSLRTGSPLPDDFMRELSTDGRTCALVFASPELTAGDEPLRGLRERLRGIPMLGCSTAGEVHGNEVHDGTVSIALLQFDHTRVRAASVAIARPDESACAGAALARQLREPDLRAVFVLSDGLLVNGSGLVTGLSAELPKGVVVTGGLAGDGDRFQRTWVLDDGVPAQGLLTGLGFYGPSLRVSHGTKGGWDVFGVERLITRAANNVLYELDGRPALDLYKEYLGDRAQDLPASGLLFPLAIRPPDGGRSVVRTILAVNEQDRSLTFAGDVPVGFRAQLMRANFDRLIQGASDAGCEAQSLGDHATPALSIAVSCVGRRLVLGTRSEEEVEATLDALPAGARQVGFYSYGELSPLANGPCELHNQTMTLTVLSEG